jgi:hypothetical protein
MKKLILCLEFFFLANFVYSQNININPSNPIEGIDLIYVENQTRLHVNFNELKGDSNIEASQNKLPLKISVEGSIIWSKVPNDEKKIKIREIELRQLATDRPFLYFTDLYDQNNILLGRSNNSNNWQKIILKIKYNIDGIQKELPNITMYPPRDVATNLQNNLKFLTPIFLTDDREIEIGIEESNKQAIKIIDLKLISENGNSVTPVNLSSLGQDISSQNGSLNLKLNLNVSPDINSNHRIEATVHYLNTQIDDQTISKDFNFVKKYDLKIIGPSYKTKVPFEQDRVEIQNIQTRGIGTLSVRFLDEIYSEKIKPQPLNISNDGSKSLFLEGFSQVEYGTGSAFYFTFNGKDVGKPNYIYKALPKVENFMFNGVDDKNIQMKVLLDESISQNNLVINVYYKQDTLGLSRGKVIKRSDNNNKEYSILIDRNISNLVGDSIFYDVKFQLEANNEKIYVFTSTLFNQKKLDEKIDILKVETAKSKRERSNEQIKNTLEEIQKIAIRLGNSVGDVEVTKALDVLEKGSKEKTIKTIEDIGKWALIAGKIFLPIL